MCKIVLSQDIERAYMSKMSFLKSDLTEANNRISDVRHRIVLQRELVQRLPAGGRETKAAEDLLRTLMRTLEAFEGDRRQIEDERIKSDAG